MKGSNETATLNWRDQEELNNLLRSDHGLRDNMIEMGFVKEVPFMRDHNDQHESQYVLTELGLREMQQRDEAMAIFMAEEQSRGKRHH